MDIEFLQEETRGGYTVTSKMKQVWAKEINMTEKLLEICQTNGLKIWADGGTLLGAIRHKGFIPWDDDIDLAMLRDDYDKLINLPPETFAPYFMQTAYSDVNYVRGHAQLRDSNSTAILLADKEQKFNQGIFVDIFVYDAVPSNKLAFYWQKLKVRVLKALMYKRFYTEIPNKLSLFRKIILAIVICIAKMMAIIVSHKTLYRKFEESFKKYKIVDNSFVSSNAFNFENMPKIIRKKEVYSETILMDFEWIKIPIPIGYDSILTNQYGNYMVPVKAPTMHGGNIIFDANRSYLDVLRELKR